jgi:hypothetical protein|tara:strand:+ start:516 stop:1316 length:801 start_codon:yes stop_codon:yes gene_type:complete
MGDPVGQISGTQQSLSDWAAPYVTNIMGKAKALGEEDYQGYTGLLTAGTSALQDQAFSGIGSLTAPTAQMGAYTPTSFTAGNTAQQYMNPYLQASLEPQIAEAQRQAQIQQMANNTRLGQANAYGGSRQAVINAESQRNLLRNLGDITATGYNTAYDKGQDQFNLEQDRLRTSQNDLNTYGLKALGVQQDAGAIQRGIDAEGVAADYAEFKEQRDYPFKQLTYQQSLLQGLPVEAMSREFIEPSDLAQILSYGGTLAEIYDKLFGK